MKANHFKIGNIVQVENDSRPESKDINHVVIQVGLIDCRLKDTSTGEEFGQYYKFIKPIEITHEHFINLGFEKTYSSKYRDVYDLPNDTRFGYNINKVYKNNPDGARWRGETFSHIKYVHELQNLYHALTANELSWQKNE